MTRFDSCCPACLRAEALAKIMQMLTTLMMVVSAHDFAVHCCSTCAGLQSAYIHVLGCHVKGLPSQLSLSEQAASRCAQFHALLLGTLPLPVQLATQVRYEPIGHEDIKQAERGESNRAALDFLQVRR